MSTLDFFITFGDSLVWPLSFILIALIVLRQAWEELHPIFVGMINSLAKNAGANATLVGIALLFGISASLSAFWDVFHSLDRKSLMEMSWHQYIAMWTKVWNPFIVAFLAKIIPTPPRSSSDTNPPIPRP